jgi:Flp pilus assembly pilin Flp
MRMKNFRRLLKGRKGQTAVEYLLTTVALAVAFSGFFAILQGQGSGLSDSKGLKHLFIAAGIKILTPYY